MLPFELRPSTPDEELLGIARQADINIFVDATEMSDQAAQVQSRWPGKQNWALWNLLDAIASGRRIAWQLQEERTLLFSAEPDLNQLRQKMLAGESIEIVSPQFDEATFEARLIDYLRREQGWTGEEDNWSRNIRIADLPHDLKREVTARAQHEALGRWMVALRRDALSDEAWRRARVRLAPRGELGGRGVSAALVLSVATPNGVLNRVVPLGPQQTSPANAGRR